MGDKKKGERERERNLKTPVKDERCARQTVTQTGSASECTGVGPAPRRDAISGTYPTPP